MKNAAYLTPGVSFTLIDERVDYAQRFCFEGGIKTWLANIVDDQEIVSQPHYLNIEGKECLVECAFQFLNSTNENLLSFVNNIPTKDGGTHVVGFKEALLTRINELAKEKDKVNKKIGELTMQDMSDGLYAIVTVKIPEPQFQ
jgi:DNA gyrase subunit B